MALNATTNSFRGGTPSSPLPLPRSYFDPMAPSSPPRSCGFPHTHAHHLGESGHDRFIPSRGSIDASFTAFLLDGATQDLASTIASTSSGGNAPAPPAAAAAGASRASASAGGGYSFTSPVFASSPSAAGSPVASPPRATATATGAGGNTTRQQQQAAAADDADKAGPGGVPEPPGPLAYSTNLARALFPIPQTSVLGLHTDSSRNSTNNASNTGGGGGGGCENSSDSKSGGGANSNDIRTSANNNNSSGGRGSAPGDSNSDRFSRSMAAVYHENRSRNFQSKHFRVIPQTPERILDAPELLDDFYLNLLDWSSRNVLAVALNHTCYLWNAANGRIAELMCSGERDNIITAVSWHGEGNAIAIGTNDGVVQVLDPETENVIRTIPGHAARVCSLAWNGSVLASGSRDTQIHLHDLRDRATSASAQGHTQEICGLKWSANGTQLASGGNDNLLAVWDFRRSATEVTPLWQFSDHSAAVKALAWNPRRPSLLASGGGTADKTLRFWDTTTGDCLNVVDTQSQVCGILWNREGTELATSHGYSENQITLWRYPSPKRIADLTGHTSRVLHLALSPDGRTVVSAAGDETIRFWKCFPPAHEHYTSGSSSSIFGSPAAASQPCSPPRASIGGDHDCHFLGGSALR